MIELSENPLTIKSCRIEDVVVDEAKETPTKPSKVPDTETPMPSIPKPTTLAMDIAIEQTLDNEESSSEDDKVPDMNKCRKISSDSVEEEDTEPRKKRALSLSEGEAPPKKKIQLSLKKPRVKQFYFDEAEVSGEESEEEASSSDKESVQPEQGEETGGYTEESDASADVQPDAEEGYSEESDASIVVPEVPLKAPTLSCVSSDEGKDFQESKKPAKVERRYRKCPVPGCLSKPQKRLANHLSKAHPSLNPAERAKG